MFASLINIDINEGALLAKYFSIIAMSVRLKCVVTRRSVVPKSRELARAS